MSVRCPVIGFADKGSTAAILHWFFSWDIPGVHCEFRMMYGTFPEWEYPRLQPVGILLVPADMLVPWADKFSVGDVQYHRVMITSSRLYLSAPLSPCASEHRMYLCLNPALISLLPSPTRWYWCLQLFGFFFVFYFRLNRHLIVVYRQMNHFLCIRSQQLSLRLCYYTSELDVVYKAMKMAKLYLFCNFLCYS